MTGQDDVPPDWYAALQGHLAAHTRYPSRALMHQIEGEVEVALTVGRDGELLAVELSKPSPHPSLNQSVRAMLKRAQPVPAPPAEIAAGGINVRVPIIFAIKKPATR